MGEGEDDAVKAQPRTVIDSRRGLCYNNRYRSLFPEKGETTVKHTMHLTLRHYTHFHCCTELFCPSGGEAQSANTEA